MNFRRFLQLAEGVLDDDSILGAASRLQLPRMDGAIPNDVPTMTRTSRISVVERSRNPIFVYLADGTRLHFTLDEFKRIPGGEPRPGRQMTIVFQRHGRDASDRPSQVHSLLVH